MKWKVEDILIHVHVLEDNEEEAMIAGGLPVKLAYSIVAKHNSAIEQLQAENQMFKSNLGVRSSMLYEAEEENKNLIKLIKDAVPLLEEIKGLSND